MRVLLVLLVAARAVAAPDPRAVEVSVSQVHSCARMSDGTVRCWGDNASGSLGDGTEVEERHTPVTVIGVKDAVEVATGLAASCARVQSGAVICWGSTSFMEQAENAPTKPHAVAELANAGKLWLSSSGDGCARWANGATKCWGTGAGALATGSTHGSWPAPALKVLADATDITVGESLGCARMRDGTVRCWGRNEQGQIGDGTQIDRLAPVAVKGLRDVVQIAVGRESACALRSDHTVWCWGSNAAGQLGDGTTTDRATPIRVPNIADATTIAAGGLHACVIRAGGVVTCWGWNRAGQLGDGKNVEESAPVVAKGVTNATSLSLTLHHTCAVRSDGEILCWGDGMRGDLGNGLQSDQLVPAPVKWTAELPARHPLPKGGVTSFAVDGLHTCASLADGSVRCWGRNDGGQVVPGARADAPFPSPTPVPNVAKARRVILTSWMSLAQLADGTTVKWGRDEAVKPAKVEANVTLFTSSDFLCQLRKDATLTCRGAESELTAKDVVQVAADMHACALHKDGTVACTGLDNHGQLGDGGSTTGDDVRKTWITVPGIHTATQIVAGFYHTCVLLADHTVSCWGDIEMTGQGNASTPGPVAIKGLKDVVQIASGNEQVCARKRDGSVACWGHYRHLMLGDRSHWYSATPVDVPWLRGATEIVLGFKHSCAMFPTGLACWGKNDAGQLGDGTMDDRDEAVPVRW